MGRVGVDWAQRGMYFVHSAKLPVGGVAGVRGDERRVAERRARDHDSVSDEGAVCLFVPADLEAQLLPRRLVGERGAERRAVARALRARQLEPELRRSGLEPVDDGGRGSERHRDRAVVRNEARRAVRVGVAHALVELGDEGLQREVEAGARDARALLPALLAVERRAHMCTSPGRDFNKRANKRSNVPYLQSDWHGLSRWSCVSRR